MSQPGQAKWLKDDEWLDVCLNCPLADCQWTQRLGCGPINHAERAGLGPAQTVIILIERRGSYFETTARLASELEQIEKCKCTA